LVSKPNDFRQGTKKFTQQEIITEKKIHSRLKYSANLCLINPKLLGNAAYLFSASVRTSKSGVNPGLLSSYLPVGPIINIFFYGGT
jgi:hypothetical protein